MGAIASQITSLTIVYLAVYSDADQRKHQSSASLAFVWGIHRGPVNSPHKWPVTRKMFPFDDVFMVSIFPCQYSTVTYHKTGESHSAVTELLMHWNCDTMAHPSMISVKSPVLLSNYSAVSAVFLMSPNSTWNINESYSRLESNVNETCEQFSMPNISDSVGKRLVRLTSSLDGNNC